MYLDYSKIKVGQTKQPALRLQTFAEKDLGLISLAYDVHFTINYTELSEITFTVPHHSDGRVNPIYEKVRAHRLVYTDDHGIYVLTSPKINNDGVSETKEVHGYSLEYQFASKDLFLAEGTYNFWNPVSPGETILGMIVEKDPTWRVGYVAPRLIGCYRTFEQYDADALSFCYSNIPERYECSIVFDPYTKTINAYDNSVSRGTLPIYLDFQNLVDMVGVEEVDDDFCTKLHLYGADNLTVTDVNPIGEDYIVDLSYFKSGGDLDVIPVGSSKTLAERVTDWENRIAANKNYYNGLIAARSSKIAQYIVEKQELSELNDDLTALIIEQGVDVQAIAIEDTVDGKAREQAKLDNVNQRISDKKDEIATSEQLLADIQTEINGYNAAIDELLSGEDGISYYAFFTENEKKILNNFLIEKTLQDDTFVATDVDTSVSGIFDSLSGTIYIDGSDITRIPVNEKYIYAIDGGKIVASDSIIQSDIIRGTLEVNSTGDSYVFSAYLGSTTYSGRTFPSGMLTLSGPLTNLSDDIQTKVIRTTNTDGDDVVTLSEDKGTYLHLTVEESRTFFTVNVSDYQKYSVMGEMYDFGQEVLAERAWPVYEFTIDSANFLFLKEFEPFKDALELGKAVYLNIGSMGRITANILGVEFGYEDPTSFKLTFSNRFQLINGVERLRKSIAAGVNASRTVDASKYINRRTAQQATEVSNYLQTSLDASVQSILAAHDQLVTINGSGVHIGGDGQYQLRLTDRMVAMTDDAWQHGKVAIGLVDTPNNGAQFIVNAEVIGGKFIVGENLIIQCPTSDGRVMQFLVDSSGMWTYNGSFVLQTDTSAMYMNSENGFAAGANGIFTLNGTDVVPTFLNDDGSIKWRQDGTLPTGLNFFIDPKTGNVYLRGNVYADNGYFSGELKAATGSFVGDVTANNFYFDDGGNVRTLIDQSTQSVDFSDMRVIDLGGIVLNGDTGNINFANAGSITWGNNTPVKYQFSVNGSSNWHSTMTANDKYRRDSLDGGTTWGAAYQFRGEDGSDGSDGHDGRDGSDANVTYANIKAALQQAASTQTTFITADSAGSPNIYGGNIYGSRFYGDEYNIFPVSDTDYTGEFNIYGRYAGRDEIYHFFQILYDGDTIGSPTVRLCSPAGAKIIIGDDRKAVKIDGYLDLTSVDNIYWGTNQPVAVFG